MVAGLLTFQNPSFPSCLRNRVLPACMACLNYSSSDCAFTYVSFTVDQAEGRHCCQYASFILLFQMEESWFFPWVNSPRVFCWCFLRSVAIWLFFLISLPALHCTSAYIVVQGFRRLLFSVEMDFAFLCVISFAVGYFLRVEEIVEDAIFTLPVYFWKFLHSTFQSHCFMYLFYYLN